MAHPGIPGPAQVRPHPSLFSRLSFQSKLARSAQYRPEIDGLRALAVLPVLFYHTDLPGFSGGFVGVDIFYVISGYLITSIIAKNVHAGRFSFTAFYERRIRRIFPALFGVVFFSLIAGALFLAPSDFAAFGKSLVAMTFFASNVFFKRTGGVDGYFGPNSHSQVFLHTWSLSVEEQFYLVFPTLLILLARFAKNWTRQWLWAIVFLSLVINIWTTQHSPRTAFYTLIPRAWELLLGALLALKAVPVIRQRFARELIGLTGLALIVWAVVLFTKDTPFPGWAALCPCLGAALVIHSGEGGSSIVKNLLSFPPLVFVGVISYSLYLYHWPIIVFAKYLSVGELSATATLVVIVLSLLLAFISYEFIESPFRGSDSPITRRQIFSSGLVTSALSAALGFAIYATHGFPVRFNDSTRQLIAENTERKSDYQDVCTNWRTNVQSMTDIAFCNVGDSSSSKKIMFWGDSHVQQLVPLVQRIHDRGLLGDHSAIFVIAAGCPPTENLNRANGYHCDHFSHFAMLRAQQQDIDNVFIAFAFPRAADLCPSIDGKCVATLPAEETRRRLFEQLSSEILLLKSRGKRVILSLPFPIFNKSIPDLEIRNAILRRYGFTSTPSELIPFNARDQLASLAANTGAELFDPRISLCSDHGCVTEFNGVSIYKDQSHIAASQIGILQDNMVDTLRRFAPADLDRAQASLLRRPTSPALQ